MDFVSILQFVLAGRGGFFPDRGLDSVPRYRPYIDTMKEKIFRFPALFTATVVGLAIGAFAQGPPIFTDTPIFLGLEGRGLRSFAQYVSQPQAKAMVLPVMLPFNPTVDLFVGAGIPLKLILPEEGDSRFGLGDANLFAKYLLWHADGPGKTLRVAGKGVLQLPTGDTEARPTLGSGTWVSQGGLVGAYVTTRYGLYAESGYVSYWKNHPDQWYYNAALGYPLLPASYPPRQINLYLEYNGSYTVAGSGTGFISPGIQFIPGRRMLVEAGMQWPVESLGAVDFTVLLGTRVLIF